MPEVSEVEPVILYNPRSDEPAPWASYMVLVRVVTKDGRVGWGETLSSIRVNALVQLVKVLSSVMKGRDVFNLEGNRVDG